MAKISFPVIKVQAKVRTEIKLPYGPPPGEDEWSAGSGYDIIGEAIGATRRGMVKYDRERHVFTVARLHTTDVTFNLADRYGQVDFWQNNHRVGTCVQACWDASDQTAINCVCVCNGLYHGQKYAPGRIVGTVGDAGQIAIVVDRSVWRHEVIVGRGQRLNEYGLPYALAGGGPDAEL